jgi:hypothetical protein
MTMVTAIKAITRKVQRNIESAVPGAQASRPAMNAKRTKK